jgi:hypothetical protein
MKKYLAILTLALGAVLSAAQPHYSRQTTAENAPKILITESPEIKAALGRLMAESESFRGLVYDAFQHPDDCPVIPIYAARLAPDQMTAITMHDSHKTGCIYIDLNQIQRSGQPLPLVIAAQVKAFHDIFVDHRDNPASVYNMAHLARTSAVAGMIQEDATWFADNVRMEMGLPPMSPIR